MFRHPLENNLSALIAMTLLLVSLASCTSQQKQAVVPGETSPLSGQIAATSWVAEHIFGLNADAAESTLTFNTDDTVSGSTGCNNYRGGVDMAGTAIQFGLLAATRKMCEPAVSGQEIAFMEALGAARSWRRLGSTLELVDENGTAVMRLRISAS
jgi:heat shock protein HslJ